MLWIQFLVMFSSDGSKFLVRYHQRVEIHLNIILILFRLQNLWIHFDKPLMSGRWAVACFQLLSLEACGKWCFPCRGKFLLEKFSSYWLSLVYMISIMNTHWKYCNYRNSLEIILLEKCIANYFNIRWLCNPDSRRQG